MKLECLLILTVECMIAFHWPFKLVKYRKVCYLFLVSEWRNFNMRTDSRYFSINTYQSEYLLTSAQHNFFLMRLHQSYLIRSLNWVFWVQNVLIPILLPWKAFKLNQTLKIAQIQKSAAMVNIFCYCKRFSYWVYECK